VHARPTHDYDTVVVGGGPAGSTIACLLRKYDPDHRVLVLERETFPREHVGESQLPAVCAILNEMGVWDKVEAQNFPVKLGASLTWGRDDESWDFDFYPVEEFNDEPRPAKYEGQRQATAFQVERSIYDKILLDHARELGCEVREGTGVREVAYDKDVDRVAHLTLETGEQITAGNYCDASGAASLFRRSLGLASDAPAALRNIAIYGYWDNAEWAVRIGVGGTRVQIRSLPYGWVWFIPLGPTRASVGLICPAEHYKKSGKKPEELYHAALQQHDLVRPLLAKATMDGDVRTTKDWSHVTERLAGANWFIVGEAAGFADPILAAGMTLHQGSAREAAYTILELDRVDRGESDLDRAWLRKAYSDKVRANIRQHIQFAQFWYASNGCFTDLQEHCQAIAAEAGLSLTPQEAWRWLAQGGFANQTVAVAKFGSFDFGAARRLVDKFAVERHGSRGRRGEHHDFEFQKYNVFKLNLLGAKKTARSEYNMGRVKRVECFERAGKLLPAAGAYDNVMRALKQTGDGVKMFLLMKNGLEQRYGPAGGAKALSDHMHAFEAMLTDGWITAKLDKKKPRMPGSDGGGRSIRSTAEGMKALEGRSATKEAG